MLQVFLAAFLLKVSFTVSILYCLLDRNEKFITKLKLVLSFFYLYCYPIFFISSTNYSDFETLIFCSLNTFSVTALIFWAFHGLFLGDINEIFEKALDYQKLTIANLAMESAFDFPRSIEWQEIKEELEEVSILLHGFLRDGRVSKFAYFYLNIRLATGQQATKNNKINYEVREIKCN